MALRIRRDGTVVCAAQTFPKDGDHYIDDQDHVSLAEYFRALVHCEISGFTSENDQAWAEIYGRCLITGGRPS